MLFVTDLESTFILDKSPLLSEFLAQIKTSAELVSMFDSIQRDAGSADSMDTSWKPLKVICYKQKKGGFSLREIAKQENR